MTGACGLANAVGAMYLGDIWPSSDEVQALLKYAMNQGLPRQLRQGGLRPRSLWKNQGLGKAYYLACQHLHCQPPFFAHFLDQGCRWWKPLKAE